MTYLEPDLPEVIRAAIAILDSDSEEYVEPNAIYRRTFIGMDDDIELRVSDDARNIDSVIILVEDIIVLDVDWDCDGDNIIDTYEYISGDWESAVLTIADEEGLL